MTDSEFIKICNDSISMSDAQRCIGIPYTSFARKAKRLGCYKVSNQIWNKGLTIDDHPAIKKGSDTYKKNYKNGLIISYQKGKPLSKKQKKSISNSMKLAHKEGRAWNIGKSRWNNQPSYPEKFFTEVINNEFLDKNVQMEYNVDIYSIDFAWVHKLKAIEIDGEQHQRFQSYKERDQRKDKILKENGWQILRIVWKDMFNDTKHWIKIAKDFIE